jgi:hypothetical protein
MGKRLTAALAIFVLIVVPLAIYVAGYLLLGERRDWWSGANPGDPLMGIERMYPQQWMPTVFRPAAKVEAWFRGVKVAPTWDLESMLRDSTTPFEDT